MAESTRKCNKGIDPDSTIHQLFNQAPQGKLVKFREDQGPQGHTILSKTSPQDTILATKEDTSSQGTENEVKLVIATTAVSQVQVDESLKNSLHSLLQHESPYAEILEELKWRNKAGLLEIHLIFK